jgi:hypothetical protein
LLCCCVQPSIQPVGPTLTGRRLHSAPATISTLVLLLSFGGANQSCNVPAAQSPASMQSILYADSGGLMTVDGVFNATSYGATRMPQSSGLVLSINLPCSGNDQAPASWAPGWVDPTQTGSCVNNGPGNWAQAAEGASQKERDGIPNVLCCMPNVSYPGASRGSQVSYALTSRIGFQAPCSACRIVGLIGFSDGEGHT